MTGRVLDLEPQHKSWFYAEKQARTRARRRVRAGRPAPYNYPSFSWTAAVIVLLGIPLSILIIPALYLAYIINVLQPKELRQQITATKEDNNGNY